MIKEKRKLLKPKDYDIVMKDPPTNLRQVVYYVNEDKGEEPVNHPVKHRYTNNELATMIDNGFKRVDKRIDKLERKVDSINSRLDYVVKTNKLVDLPKKK